MTRAPALAIGVLLSCSGCELRPVSADTTSLQDAQLPQGDGSTDPLDAASTLDATVDSVVDSHAQEDAPAEPCASPKTLCAGACVDTSQDPNHCGGCDQPCVGDPPGCSQGRCDIEKLMHLACEGNVMATSQYLYVACQDQLVRVPRDHPGAIEYLDTPAADVPDAGLTALTTDSLTYVYRASTSSGDLELSLRQWNEVKQTAESIVTVTVPAPNGGDLVVAGTRVFAISSSPEWAGPSDIYLVTQSGEVAGPSADHCGLVRWFAEGETMYWEEYGENLPSGYTSAIARFNPTSLAKEVLAYLEDDRSLAAVSDAHVYVSSASNCTRYPKAGGAVESAGTHCPTLFSPQFDFASYYYSVTTIEKRPKGQQKAVLTRKLGDWSQIWAAWADDEDVIAKVYSAGPLPYYYRVRMPTPQP